MSDKSLVEITTKIRINDVDENYSPAEVTIDKDGQLELTQDNDRVIFANKAASIALAKIILQHHRVSFEAVYQEEVDYTA